MTTANVQRLTPSVAALALASICALTAPAQTAPAPPDKSLQFEVATIKPVDQSPGVWHVHGAKVYPGGRVVLSGFSLQNLVFLAFRLGGWQMSGFDDWMTKVTYDVEAKPPETSSPTAYSLRYSNDAIEDEHLRHMLQSLLIDRFQLKFHRETKSGLVFLLEKTGKPIRLVPTKAAFADSYGQGYGEISYIGGDEWFLYNTSMQHFTEFASDYMVKRPVLDRTGLEGGFDFRWKLLSVSSDPQSLDPTDSFKFLLQEIGLKLTPSTGPIETLVIDHAEPPSLN